MMRGPEAGIAVVMPMTARCSSAALMLLLARAAALSRKKPPHSIRLRHGIFIAIEIFS
jgi:hypothetical protein